MARIVEPDPQQAAAWSRWVNERPENVQAVAGRFDPWSLYRLKSTGERCTISSFSESDEGKVMITVDIPGDVAFERKASGIDPDDLEPYELPDLDKQGD